MRHSKKLSIFQKEKKSSIRECREKGQEGENINFLEISVVYE